jgi:hypothetical protein
MGMSDHEAELQRQSHKLAAQQRRMDELAVQVGENRKMIGDLQVHGLVSEEHAAQLEQALLSSRTIGTAIGILMASRQVGHDQAVTILKEASQNSNRKIRDLAAEIVESADRGELLDSRGAATSSVLGDHARG